MYPYLFGIDDLRMYDLIGLLGIVAIFVFFLWRRTWPVSGCAVGKEYMARYADQNPVPLPGRAGFWTAVEVVLPLVVHLLFYALGGERFALLVGRATEFLGYVSFSAVGMALAAGALGCAPLRWLDRTVPLYLSMASVLKLSCFCAGCCHGYPWEYGLYNQRNMQTEFPIQLVEMALYAVLLLILLRYEGRPGQRFSLFLVGYGAARFLVQFFRADRTLFSAFHWLGAVACAVGLLGWVLCYLWAKKEQNESKEP